MIEGESRVCIGCDVEKPSSEFYNFHRGQSRCKPCTKAKRAAYFVEYNSRPENVAKKAARNQMWFQENKQEIAERRRAARAENEEALRTYRQAYYQANRDRIAERTHQRRLAPESFRETSRRYREKFPDKAGEVSRRYHARRRGAGKVEKGVTWRSVSERDGMSCTYCGIQCDPSDGFHKMAKDGANRWVCGSTYPTVDHVVPVSMGGDHALSNVVLACKRCNASKGAKVVAQR